ncbi:MAG: pyrimidine/purine nucleoside phosphorylase [Gammaproteobacteria bacterium]|nr:pyrimidine/purine nucleoside phosphorylase [Gammaproteobacteria bacterium]
MSQFNDVSVVKEANVFFDGQCISHTILTADGSRKSLGVILPGTLVFNTGAPERMELLKGECRVRLQGDESWQNYSGGESFNVEGESRFEIEVFSIIHYVCHFG